MGLIFFPLINKMPIRKSSSRSRSRSPKTRYSCDIGDVPKYMLKNYLEHYKEELQKQFKHTGCDFPTKIIPHLYLGGTCARHITLVHFLAHIGIIRPLLLVCLKHTILTSTQIKALITSR